MKSESQTHTTTPFNTTFSTWGRVAEDHMQRMSDAFTKGSELQKATLEQGREFVAYNMKLATEWQAWASESSRKFAGQFFATK
jgi:hypothetical protein